MRFERLIHEFCLVGVISPYIFFCSPEASQSAWILPLHTTSSAISHLDAASINFFATAALHPISLTAKSIAFAELSALYLFFSRSDRNAKLCRTYRDTDSVCLTQLTIDGAIIRSDSLKFKYNGSPLKRISRSSGSTLSHSLLAISVLLCSDMETEELL